MVLDYELNKICSFLNTNVQIVRKPKKLTDVSNSVTSNFNQINVQVPTLQIQLLKRPLSGSMEDSVKDTSQCLFELGQF